MSTLLLRLTGPMQSWGTTSRFNQRDTGKEPSKSGVLGLLAASMGIDRDNWTDLEPLTRLSMGVRRDRPGMLKSDYQTAGAAAADTIIKAGGGQSKDGVVSKRYYLADASFLVALEGPDKALLVKAHNALKNPVWPLALGRKSYVPSESIWMENAVLDLPLMAALESWPWTSSLRKWEKSPDKLLVSTESRDGSGLMKMDQPLSSFAERRFGARFTASRWIPFPKEAPHVSD